MRSIPRFLLIISAILLPLLLAASTTVQAQAQTQSGLTLAAEIGFDGYAKEGKWIPVHIQVENNGSDLDGEVRVFYRDYAGTSTIYSEKVSLPSTSRKEFYIYTYYPQGGLSNLKVQFFSKNKVLVEKNVRVSNVTPQSMIIGVMSDSQSTFNILNQIQAPNGVIRLVEIKSTNLPDRAQGWEQLDAVIISDTDTGTLSAEQRKALELWVAKGGKLFVSGGPKWQATLDGVKNLLPLQISGTIKTAVPPETSAYTSESFPENTESILALGDLSSDAKILIEQDGQPLMLQKELGYGKVFFFAADPGLAPFKNWNGMLAIYNHLLGFVPQQPAWANGKWESYSTNEAMTTIAELNIPSIYFICGWLAFYIILIGPVNYFVLKLLKKRELAWITIPAIVIIVSAVSYIYGFIYRGNKPTLNRLTVVQAWDGVSQAASNSLVGIYSPQRDKYTIQSTDNFLLYPYNSQDSTLQSSTSWLSIQEANTVITPDIPIEIGGMKIIGVDGTTSPLKIQHDLNISFENGPAKISGSITNQSNVTLYDTVLVTPGRWKALGDITSGETKKADVSLTVNSSGPEFYNAGAIAILNYSYTDLENNEVARRREALLRSILISEYGESDLNWGIYLIGWLKEPSPSADLNNVSSTINDTTLYIQKVSPTITAPASTYTLGPSLFEWQASGVSSSPYYSSEANNGEYTFRFRSVIPIHSEKVETLILSIDSYTSPQSVNVTLWDYSLNNWSPPLVTNWGNTQIHNPEKYIGPNGEVMLKIKDMQGNWLELRKSTISMVVQP